MRCMKCGTELQEGSAFCDYCGTVQKELDTVTTRKKSNLAAGFVGALIGSVIGGAAIILVSRLGFVAGICGLILAVCTLKGYEIMGGTLDKTGLLVCLALMVITPYVADRLDWALLLMEDYKATYNESLSLGFAFSLIPDLLSEGAIEMETYATNLGMVYVFTVLGAAKTVMQVLKKG